MSSRLAKEAFVGKYYPFETKASLPEGSIIDGKNMMRKGLFGGWTPRKGYTLVNATAYDKIEDLQAYKNPFFDDYHIFVHIGSELYSLDTSTEGWVADTGESYTTESSESYELLITSEPLSQVSSLGTAVYTLGSETPGFSAVVGEDLIYCNGGTAPLIYGGSKPNCDAFIVFEGATSTYIDYTEKVTDQKTNTYAVITANASTKYFVGIKEKASAIHLTFSQTNTNTITPTVKAYRSGSWTDTSASDGTAGTETHDIDGAFTFAESSSDTLYILKGRQLYWYEISFSGAPTEIHITSCRVVRSLCEMTPKWDGGWRSPTSVVFYDNSAGTYTDVLGKVTDGSNSTYLDASTAQTADYLYIGTTEKALGFFIVVDGTNINTADAQIDLVESLTSAGWATVGTFTDESLDEGGDSSFAQSGPILIADEHSAQEAALFGDTIPKYWHRISWDAALSATSYITEIYYASWPDALPKYKGCVEFNGKLVLWGDPYYRNRLTISPYLRPDMLANRVENFTIPFGDASEIKNVIVSGNYLVIYKEIGIYFWNESLDYPITISNSFGLSSPKSAVLISSGDKTLKTDEYRTILMHQDKSGVYKITVDSNGYQVVRVSEQIRNYFLPTESEYIGETELTNCQAEYDKITDTYRLFLADKVLCYLIGTSEWLPPWEYELTLTTGLSTYGPNGDQIFLAGTDEGHIIQLEKVGTDRSTGNAETAIEHYAISRPIFADESGVPFVEGILRSLWIETLADSGSYTITKYINRATSGDSVSTPSAPSLAESGYNVKLQAFDLSDEAVNSFQFKFYSNTLNQKLELYSFSYNIDNIRTV